MKRPFIIAFAVLGALSMASCTTNQTSPSSSASGSQETPSGGIVPAQTPGGND